MSRTKQLREPFRVAVWGPGSVGVACIREVLLLPELTLTSVLAYSDAKNGVDAGTLVGMNPVGIAVTTSVEQFLESRPEAVIYTARDYGDWRSDADIIQLLEKGIDVITALPYHYPGIRGDEVVARLEAAAKKGGATLFGTGINPGILYERIAMAASGLCNAVEHMSLAEYVNCEHMPGAAQFLTVMGFGMKKADQAGVERTAALVGNYLTQYLHYAADQMGLKIDRIVRDDQHVNTPKQIVIPDLFTLEAGTVALVRFRWTAWCDGKPMLSTQVNWYVTDDMRPEIAQGKGDDFWIVEIDGRPGVRVTVELFGTLKGREVFHPDNPSNVSLLSTGLPAIQAIPQVIAASPGILCIDPPQFHWKKDLRA